MKIIATLLFVLLAMNGQSQTVTIMDFVKIKKGKNAEAMYFYENNWILYRKEALKKGFITSFRIEKTVADSAADFDLILITEYKDKASHAKSEENFSDILKTLRPNGPVLLNELKPAEFRKNVFLKVTERVFGM